MAIILQELDFGFQMSWEDKDLKGCMEPCKGEAGCGWWWWWWW